MRLFAQLHSVLGATDHDNCYGESRQKLLPCRLRDSHFRILTIGMPYYRENIHDSGSNYRRVDRYTSSCAVMKSLSRVLCMQK